MQCRKENISTHSMRMPVLEKERMQTLGFARMDLEQIKEARLSRIVALGKGAGLLNSHMNLNERHGVMGQWAWVLGSQLGPTSQKKYINWLRSSTIHRWNCWYEGWQVSELILPSTILPGMPLGLSSLSDIKKHIFDGEKILNQWNNWNSNVVLQNIWLEVSTGKESKN